MNNQKILLEKQLTKIITNIHINPILQCCDELVAERGRDGAPES